MLKHLSIKNIAVIEGANIDFENGFTALTGESGAGKSIIIDAINILKGEKASKDLIRYGEDFLKVDGEFYVDDNCAKNIYEIINDDDIQNEIIISRKITQDGKNTIRVNGNVVNLSMLKEIGENLINIHGQHDNTSLLKAKTHIDVLDKFGFNKISPLLDEYKKEHQNYLSLLDELESANMDESEKERKKDMLLFQIEELTNADLKEGEDTELEERKNTLLNFSKISDSVNKSYALLYDDAQNVHDLLWSAVKGLENASSYSNDIKDIFEQIQNSAYQIDESLRELKNYKDHMDYDEGELNEIENRLDTIYTLKRKYAPTIEKILEFLDNANKELESIELSSVREAELQKLIDESYKKREDLANKLTKARCEFANILSENTQKHLKDLNMEKVIFEVKIEKGDYSYFGCDNVEFFVCTNVGEEKKPLSKIASGGELSRIMLAIKNALAEFDTSKTLIFDEIDSGVSGNAASKIGEKLYLMSKCSQVISITHLPQVAAFCDYHYLIEKTSDDVRTKTNVLLLSNEERIKELARTLTSDKITKASLENAKEMIENSNKIKKNI